jgi:hypothetical protein
MHRRPRDAVALPPAPPRPPSVSHPLASAPKAPRAEVAFVDPTRPFASHLDDGRYDERRAHCSAPGREPERAARRPRGRISPERRIFQRLNRPRVAPHAAPERAGAVGPLRAPAGDEGSGRGRTGDEPARERGKAVTGPAARPPCPESPFRVY